jgi:hypothetical protein
LITPETTPPSNSNRTRDGTLNGHGFHSEIQAASLIKSRISVGRLSRVNEGFGCCNSTTFVKHAQKDRCVVSGFGFRKTVNVEHCLVEGLREISGIEAVLSQPDAVRGLPAAQLAATKACYGSKVTGLPAARDGLVRRYDWRYSGGAGPRDAAKPYLPRAGYEESIKASRPPCLSLRASRRDLICPPLRTSRAAWQWATNDLFHLLKAELKFSEVLAF